MTPDTLLVIGRVLYGTSVVLGALWDPAAKRACSDPWGLIRYRHYFGTTLGKWHAAITGVMWLAAMAVFISGLVWTKQLQKAALREAGATTSTLPLETPRSAER